MENIKIKIYDMVEDIKFCKKEFGEWQFNKQYNFSLGYVRCLYDNNIINEEEYEKYNNMIYETY